jgi:hypothetical protein
VLPGPVVLVAHSQGTIIAAATLMQARKADERYPLLTFGSPLRRLYACNFPAYFGRNSLDSLKTFPEEPARRRWINLWALTDPIGAWVFTTKSVYVQQGDPPAALSGVFEDVDCRVFDVPQQIPRIDEYDVAEVKTVCGHSGFWQRGEYVKAVDALQALVVPESENRTVNATAQPNADKL